MNDNEALSHRQLLGYASLILFLLVVLALSRSLAPGSSPIVVAHDSLPLVSSQPLADSLYVNSATVRQFRKAGFSNYEITRIYDRLERGFVFDSIQQLAAIPYFDTAHLFAIEPFLVFSSAPDPRHAKSLRVHQYFQAMSHDAPLRSRRVSLFYADSADLASAGLSTRSWDSLVRFRRDFVIKGSVQLDSLVQASPDQLAQLLAAHCTAPKTRYTQAPKPVAAPSVCNLNSASVQQLYDIPYVRGFSKSIIAYRDRLGGFVSYEQLREVYGLSDSCIANIVRFTSLDPSSVKRIDANDTNDTKLQKHPYFKPVARTISKARADARKHLSEDMLRHALRGDSISPFAWHYLSY